jgi:hypothetical protein
MAKPSPEPLAWTPALDGLSPDIDVETCPRCGGPMRLLALVTEPASVARFLRHLGEPTAPPARALARDPRFFQSRALRRHGDELPRQLGLFEEH